MTKLLKFMDRCSVSPVQLAKECERSPMTIINWLTDTTVPPPYIFDAIRQIEVRNPPATVERATEYDTTGLVKKLHVSQPTAMKWILEQNFPRAALLAIGWHDRKRNPLAPRQVSDYQKQVLANITIGKYRRSEALCRSSPVMGKSMPDIRTTTVNQLIDSGYVVIRNYRLTVTRQGQKVMYDD